MRWISLLMHFMPVTSPREASCCRGSHNWESFSIACHDWMPLCQRPRSLGRCPAAMRFRWKPRTVAIASRLGLAATNWSNGLGKGQWVLSTWPGRPTWTGLLH